MLDAEMTPVDYTIPSDNRELQHEAGLAVMAYNYTIPSDNRELQRRWLERVTYIIIPYQVITGNYNPTVSQCPASPIIPYQVITGNYNCGSFSFTFTKLYHTK